MNGSPRTIALVVASLLLAAPAVRAADQRVPGTKLLLKSANGREILSFKSNGPITAPAPGSGDDPTNVGATLEILNPGTMESSTFNLPSMHWTLSGTTFRYVDSALVESGKVKIALIGRILKVSGKKIGITLDEASQGTLDVVLTSGTIRYCAAFGPGSVKRDQPGRFIARSAAAPGSCPGASTTTTTMTPTTTSSSSSVPGSTTSTSMPPTGCDCCACSQLNFTTSPPDIGTGTCATTDGTVSGTVQDDTGATLCNLRAGGLYFGGAGVGVPLPAAIPDMSSSVVKIASCDTPTGALTYAATTDTDIGGAHPNWTCSAAGVVNPEYPGKTGCLFGPPLPIPNTNSAATSTCVVNRIATNASGSGNCGDGSSNIDLPLLSDIYLTGPTDGLIPCPRCAGPSGSETCQAGPNNGQPCTPGDSALGAAYPTSHDCPPASGAFIGSLPIPFALTTGVSTKTAADLPGQQFVFCGFCGQQFAPTFESPPRPCTANSDCTNGLFNTCKQRTSGAFGQGPARTISETGAAAGVCIDDALPHAARLVSVFCVPASGNATVDASADIPGPGSVALAGEAQVQSCTVGTTTTTSSNTLPTLPTTTTMQPCGGTFPTCSGTCPGTSVCGNPVAMSCTCFP